MSDNVIRLVDHAPGYAIDPQKALGEWLVDWAQHFAEGKPGEISSLVVVVEGANGSVGIIKQGRLPLDRARTAGLLSIAVSRLLFGESDIEGIKD